MDVTKNDIILFIREQKLSGKIVCIHSSLKSFGMLEGGAQTIADAFLAEGCTILVPTLSWNFNIGKEALTDYDRGAELIISIQQAWDFSISPLERTLENVYHVNSHAIDRDMGALSKYVVQHPDRKRSNNPLSSFCALGPQATALMENQTSFYHPLERLVSEKGAVVLMGVDIDKMTLIHRAKQLAGHHLLLRLVNGYEGKPRWVQGGGCSSGFLKLKPLLVPVIQEQYIGSCLCKVLAAEDVLITLKDKLEEQSPNYPICDNASCTLCAEAQGAFPLIDENDFHKIEIGDTFWSIAQKRDLPLDAFHIVYGESFDLVVGERLRLPIVEDTDYYKIMEGDSVWSISQKLQIPFKQLEEISKGQDIIPGAFLKLFKSDFIPTQQ